MGIEKLQKAYRKGELNKYNIFNGYDNPNKMCISHILSCQRLGE